jgi:hypothetical protein
MRRPPSRLTASLVAGITLAAIGCNDGGRPPTGPAEPEGPAAVSGVAMAAATSPLQFSQISPGARFTCGLATDGRAFCWGINFAGQLGDGTTGGTRSPPADVRTSKRISTMTTGASRKSAETTNDLA